MSDLSATAQRLLEAIWADDWLLKVAKHNEYGADLLRAAEDFRAALAEPEADPVAYWLHGTNLVEFDRQEYHSETEWTPLYTHPATQRQPLTGDEIRAIAKAGGWDGSYQSLKFARAIERAHGITGEVK